MPMSWFTVATTKPHHHSSLGLLLLSVLVIVIVASAPAPASTSNDLNSDRQALLDFAAAVPHPRSTTRRLNWLSNSSLCFSWSGVTCSSSNASSPRVVSLRLPAAGFYGSIPPNTLGRLDALSVLSLRSNALRGPLPPDLLSLPSLRYVYLHHNNLSGDIPSSLSPQLTFLDLSFNAFRGTLPSAINNLSRLAALNLNDNSLSGPIPAPLSSGLEKLNLSNNRLNGSIPPSLRRFPASSFQGNSQLCGIPLIPCLPLFSPSSPSPAPALPPSSSVPTSTTSQNMLPLSPQNHNHHHRHLISTGSAVAIAVGASAVLLALGSKLLCRTTNKTEAATADKTTPLNAIYKSNHPTNDNDGDQEAQNNNNNNNKLEKLVFLQGGGGGGSSFHNLFDLDDLLRSSAEVLGKGTYGTTYKAILEEGTQLAVKRLGQGVVGKAKAEFQRQMEDVGSLSPHPNVASIRAYYYSKDEKLLVYDYVPFVDLNTLLHGK